MAQYESNAPTYADAFMDAFPEGDIKPSKKRMTGRSHWRLINDDTASKRDAKLLTYPGRALNNKRRHRHGRTTKVAA